MRNIWLLHKVARKALLELNGKTFVNQKGLDQAVKIIASITGIKENKKRFGLEGLCPSFTVDFIDGKMHYHIVCLWLATQNGYLKMKDSDVQTLRTQQL